MESLHGSHHQSCESVCRGRGIDSVPKQSQSVHIGGTSINASTQSAFSFNGSGRFPFVLFLSWSGDESGPVDRAIVGRSSE